MVNLQDHKDWSSLNGPWTRDQIIEGYFESVRKFVHVRWYEWSFYRPGVDIEELQSIALEELVHAATDWPEWAKKKNPTGIDSRAAFWGYVKQRVSFRLIEAKRKIIGRSTAAHLARATISTDALIEDTEKLTQELLLVHHELEDHAEPSLLHEQIVNAVAALTKQEQLVLALSTVDRLDRLELSNILGTSVTKIRTVYRNATVKLHAAALNLVSEEQQPRPATERVSIPLTSGHVTSYIRKTHGCSVVQYLELARRYYFADLATTLDLIRDGNTSTALSESMKATA